MNLLIEVLLSTGGGLHSPNGDFLVLRYTSRKIFTKVWSAVIIWSGAPLLGFGGGLLSPDDFQNVTGSWDFLSQDSSLAKFS